ncbi:MAG: hypothetical protein AAF483_12580 [Planctomycetota bacterium]
MLATEPAGAWQVEESKERYAKCLGKWIVELKSQIQELVRLEELGQVTEGERDFNEALLAAIQYESKRLGRDGPQAELHLQEFIAIEQRRLDRLKPLRQLNAIPAITMTHVRSGLHFGKFHMARLKGRRPQEIEQLKEFVRLSEREVESYILAVKSSSVSPCEVSVANHQLLFARYLLGKRQGDFETILPEIHNINLRLESDWLAARKLHERRLITLLDAYIMELYYLESQLLLAAIEGAKGSMTDLLRQRVELHNRVLAKGREVGWGPTVALFSQVNLECLLSCSSAFDRFLLDRLVANGEFEYESMLLFGL